MKNSGMFVTYSEDIERLVSMKCGLYKIPGYEREDVGQEIRMVCVRAIQKYDPTKNHSTPFHFLARCVDNRLRNLLRDNGATIAKSKKNDKRAIERSERKKKLQNASTIGPEEHIVFSNHYPTDFIEEIEQRLPEEVRCSFHLLIRNGPPSISKKHLKLIKKTIKELWNC
jgi:DNA-directed RNA polymerase specialized sigma24 family protein